MPQAIPLIIGAVVSTVVSFGIKLVASLLTPKPKQPTQTLDQRQQGATVTARQPIAYWRCGYGEARTGGQPIYMGTTENNDKFHVVAAEIAHEIDSFEEFVIGDQWVHPDDLDANGYTQPGGPLYFSGNPMVRIQTKLGTANQTAFSILVTETAGEWSSDHRARGHALLYVRYNYQPTIFPGGLPNQSSVKRLKKVYDPRDGSTKWTPNFALCIRDFLLTPKDRGGYGMAAVDETNFAAAANICDEIVDSPTSGDAAVSHTITGVSADYDRLSLDGETLKLQTGDRVELEWDGTPPAGLAVETSYYVIAHRRRASKVSTSGAVISRPSIKLATSLANARDKVAIDITDAGTGSGRIVKTGEPRWELHGTYTLDQSPRKVLEDMLASASARVPEGAGVMRLMGLAWQAPTLVLDENDARGPIRVQTRRPRRDRFNTVRGTYVSPLNDYQPSDYPAVSGANYVAEDGETIASDYPQPYTSRPGQAQRAAKIELVRNRFERTISFPGLLPAYDCKVGEIIAITNARRGWEEKPFEVLQWKPRLDDAGDGGAPYLGVDIDCNEADSSIFDWATNEEQAVGPVIPPTLPNWSAVPSPGAPEVTETLYEGRDGSDVKARVTLTWAASPSALVDTYETEFKPSSGGSDAWVTFAPPTNRTVLTAERNDVLPDMYDFRVRGRTLISVTPWATTVNRVVFGLSAAPASLSGLTLQKLGGHAVLRWALSEDLDVLRGGWIEFRHSPLTSGASEGESTTIGDRIDGRTTQVVLPLKEGTYFARAIDKVGNYGPWATVSTDGATVIAYGAVDDLTEDPDFSGTKTNCAVAGGVLSLSGTGDFDDIADFDAVVDLDAFGGISDTGSYEFSAGIDLSTVQRVRVRSHVLATITNDLDQFDERTATVDEWESFDGDTAPGAGDAWVEMRATDDDPAGTPTWGAWERLDVSEFNNRAFEFRAQLRAYDPAYNVNISQLRVFVENVV